LLLICARMSKGAGRSWDTQQGECQEEFVHGVTSFRLRRLQRPWRGKKCLSFHHHRMVVFGKRWGLPQQQDEWYGGK
jgi:hypothetical protein